MNITCVLGCVIRFGIIWIFYTIRSNSKFITECIYSGRFCNLKNFVTFESFFKRQACFKLISRMKFYGVFFHVFFCGLNCSLDLLFGHATFQCFCGMKCWNFCSRNKSHKGKS